MIQANQIETGIQVRRVRTLCPACGGDIADKVQMEAGKTVATKCRCCSHVWNIRNVRRKK